MLGWSCSFTALCLLRSQAESSPGAAGGDAAVVAWPQLPQQSSGSKANRTGSEAAITGERTSVYCGFFGCFSFRVSLCLGPGSGCQRGFGVSVHSLGSCLILASKLGLQLPALCSLGSVAAAVNWAAA